MTASTTNTRESLFIGGKWVPSSGSGSIEVIDSTTEEVFGTVPEGTPADVDAAVGAARGRPCRTGRRRRWRNAPRCSPAWQARSPSGPTSWPT